MPMPESLTRIVMTLGGARGADPDVSFGVRVFRGVREQVGEHLRESQRIRRKSNGF